MARAVCVLILLSTGCGRVAFEPTSDAGALDAGVLDAGVLDARVLDARVLDGGVDAADAGGFTVLSIEPPENITGRAWTAPAIIRGTGLSPQSTVVIGGLECGSTVFVSDRELRCTGVGALPIGPADVTLRSDGGASQTLAGGFVSLGQPVVWLRADTIGLADGSSVARWDDGSGHGNHALQATADRQPTLRTTAADGEPAIEFGDSDGTFDFLNIVDSPSLRPSAITVAAVAAMTRVTSYAKIISRTYRSDGTHASPFQSYSMGMSQAMTGQPYFDLTTGAGITAAVHDQSSLGAGFGVVIGSYGGSTVSTHYRGTATGAMNNRSESGAIDYTAMSVDVAIGIRSRYLPQEALVGSIAELFVYPSELSGSERDALSAYLRARYGL